MIYDKLENLPRYAECFPYADKVIAFLKKCAGAVPAVGRHELDGKKLFVNVQEYAPKVFDPEKLEYHLDYIDIQLLFSGAEKLYFAPIEDKETVTGYSAEKDCGMKRIPAPEAGVELPLVPGYFVLLFPGEGHLPGVGDPATKVVKAVVKIAVK